MLITLFLLLLLSIKILKGLSVKVLYFYTDYFLLITDIVFVFALLKKALEKWKKKDNLKKELLNDLDLVSQETKKCQENPKMARGRV